MLKLMFIICEGLAVHFYLWLIPLSQYPVDDPKTLSVLCVVGAFKHDIVKLEKEIQGLNVSGKLLGLILSKREVVYKVAVVQKEVPLIVQLNVEKTESCGLCFVLLLKREIYI